ncbi:hypothetical protein SRHO_G00042550 [Serrasalmus rhombeus]
MHVHDGGGTEQAACAAQTILLLRRCPVGCAVALGNYCCATLFLRFENLPRVSSFPPCLQVFNLFTPTLGSGSVTHALDTSS